MIPPVFSNLTQQSEYCWQLEQPGNPRRYSPQRHGGHGVFRSENFSPQCPPCLCGKPSSNVSVCPKSWSFQLRFENLDLEPNHRHVTRGLRSRQGLFSLARALWLRLVDNPVPLVRDWSGCCQRGHRDCFLRVLLEATRGRFRGYRFQRGILIHHRLSLAARLYRSVSRERQRVTAG